MPRIAEITAGLVQTTLNLEPVDAARADAFGYRNILDMVARVKGQISRPLVLHFTALEKTNAFSSAIAFYRITSSLIERYEDIVTHTRIKTELKKDGEQKEHNTEHVLTRQPYLVGQFPKARLAKLEDLKKLKQWIEGSGVSIGPLRDLEKLVLTDFGLAKKGYARWRAQMEKKKEEGVDPSAFDHLLAALSGAEVLKSLPFSEGPRAATPLFDALDWREVL